MQTHYHYVSSLPCGDGGDWVCTVDVYFRSFFVFFDKKFSCFAILILTFLVLCIAGCQFFVVFGLLAQFCLNFGGKMFQFHFIIEQG